MEKIVSKFKRNTKDKKYNVEIIITVNRHSTKMDKNDKFIERNINICTYILLPYIPFSSIHV